MTIHFNQLYRTTAGQLFLAGLLSFLTSCASTKSTAPVNSTVADGKAVRTKKSFKMDYKVAVTINAKPETIWALLTDAAAYPAWNTTIDSIEGKIALGEKIKLHAKISPNRAFKLKVSRFDTARLMIWSDGNFMFKGVRTFTLEPMGNDSTVFVMQEKFSGAMLPMIAGSLPDFSTSFETFAADLKRKAESIAK